MPSAAITTFEPHTDTTYAPCISLLDFWRAAGPPVVHAKSAHVYEPELGLMAELSA